MNQWRAEFQDALKIKVKKHDTGCRRQCKPSLIWVRASLRPWTVWGATWRHRIDWNLMSHRCSIVLRSDEHGRQSLLSFPSSSMNFYIFLSLSCLRSHCICIGFDSRRVSTLGVHNKYWGQELYRKFLSLLVILMVVSPLSGRTPWWSDQWENPRSLQKSPKAKIMNKKKTRMDDGRSWGGCHIFCLCAHVHGSSMRGEVVSARLTLIFCWVLI